MVVQDVSSPGVHVWARAPSADMSSINDDRKNDGLTFIVGCIESSCNIWGAGLGCSLHHFILMIHYKKRVMEMLEEDFFQKWADLWRN